MLSDNKFHLQHVDNIEAAGTDSSLGRNAQSAYVDENGSNDNGDEIVQNLAQAGEEVGMTWRSILAAGVSPGLSPT
jgi:hypothetical protein